MKRYAVNLILAMILCFLGDVFAEGVIFAAALFLTMPKIMPPAYVIPLGAFASSCVAMLSSGNIVLFWGLFVFSVVSISIYSMPKGTAVALAAMAVLSLSIEPRIYVPAFLAFAYNGIFYFTFEKKRAII